MEHEQGTPPVGGEVATPAIERLAAAAEALDAAIARITARLEAQQAELGEQVGRIVAAVDETAAARQHLEARVAELERANADLKAEAADLRERAARKTLPPVASALLAKSGVELPGTLDAAALDRALTALSVEQRIAVKAEMARAGIIT
jgi:DNA repair exonuclease SbcCD ATPase subunit